MKKAVFISFLSLLFVIGKVFSQQDFKSNYDFKPILQNNKLYSKDKDRNLKLISLNSISELKGVIKSVSTYHDTLTVRFWYFEKDSLKKIYNDKNLEYKIFLEQLSEKTTESEITPKLIKIPFSSQQLFAMNIPLRVNLKDGKFSSKFINANVSYSMIWGKTRIYKSEFVEPRNRFWGLGVFGGFGETTDSDEKDIVGVNYGINLIINIHSFNFLLASGLETGAAKKGNTNPFLGFGVGFDLFKVPNGGYENK